MASYQIVRSIQVSSSPQRVFELLADYRTWTTWSPWLLSEPEAKVTVSEDPASVGSTYAWEGDVTGSGQLEHKKLVPYTRIEDELRFLKPFKSTCGIQFDLQGNQNGAKLEWTMNGSMPWFLFWMIPMFKTYIGMDFQRGLNMIKELTETGHITSKTHVHGIETCGPLRMAGIVGSCQVNDVGPAIDKAFSEANSEISKLGLTARGQMISVYTKFRVKEQIFDFISGYTIPAEARMPNGTTLKTWELPSCKAFRVEHIGSYGHLGNAWSVANQLARHRKLKQRSCGAFEIYRKTPPQFPEAELQTDIYLPLK